MHPKKNSYFQSVTNDSSAHIEDKDLLSNYYRNKNNYWLGVLLERYTMLLFGLCLKYLKDEEEAKDAVQQIFLKVMTELDKYKVEYFKSWLYMIAKNHCLMKLRSSGKLVSLDDNVHSTSEVAESKTEHLQKEKALLLLEDGLHELNEEQKVCVTLFYLQHKSYNDIAQQTGYSLLKVKSYIQNGKRNLKMFVEKQLQKENG